MKHRPRVYNDVELTWCPSCGLVIPVYVGPGPQRRAQRRQARRSHVRQPSNEVIQAWIADHPLDTPGNVIDDWIQSRSIKCADTTRRPASPAAVAAWLTGGQDAAQAVVDAERAA